MTLNVIKNLRIIPRDSGFLDRRKGSLGEIFYDRNTNSLRLFDGDTSGGISLAKSDFSNVSNSDFLNKAISAGLSNISGQGNFELSVVGDDSTELTITAGNTLSLIGDSGISTTTNPANGELLISNTATGFSRIAVDGEGNVDADLLEDVLNLEAGENISLTVDSENKTITISSSGGGSGGNSFSTISVLGQNNIVADSQSDTLTLEAGSGITLTTNAATDTITITNIVSASTIFFSALSDTTTAGLTVDEIFLPAITTLNVTNSGASAYLFDQYSGTNPTIYAVGGMTIGFKLLSTGHPFLIQDGSGNNYNNGLIHVSTTGVVSTGSDAQGKDSGTLYWKIPAGISGGYRYQCSIHAPMVGSLVVKNIITL